MIILVAKPDALDQYFMKHTDDFFERPFEAAILDPHNPYVVRRIFPAPRQKARFLWRIRNTGSRSPQTS